MYYAIIGDIIDSKKIRNRYEVQEAIKNYFQEINACYQEYLAADFYLTIGDEFQALFYKPDKLFEIIAKIEVKFYPLKIRFGIGIGEIFTKLEKRIPIGSDGPVWWSARNAIDELKESHEKGTRYLSNIKIINSNIKSLTYDLINISISLSYSIKEKWTAQQRKIIDYIILNYGLVNKIVQNQVAQELNLKPSNLNKKLKLSRFFDYSTCFDKIVEILNEERTKGGILNVK